MVGLRLMKFLLKVVGNILVVYLLNTFLPAYVTIVGGLPAYIILGLLLMILNMTVRPILKLITFPLHFIFSILATIIVNILFLWIVYQVSLLLDPNILVFALTGGVVGWLVVSTVLGIANWFLKWL